MVLGVGNNPASSFMFPTQFPRQLFFQEELVSSTGES